MASDLRQIKGMMQVQVHIPPQVLLSKPVTLLDACGKVSAFHLDFINSAEAFVAVLKIRFEQEGVTPPGVRMLDKSQFILRDHRGPFNLSKPWNKLVRPNQKINMSMLFRRTVPPSTCPACYCRIQTSDEEVEW